MSEPSVVEHGRKFVRPPPPAATAPPPKESDHAEASAPSRPPWSKRAPPPGTRRELRDISSKNRNRCASCLTRLLLHGGFIGSSTVDFRAAPNFELHLTPALWAFKGWAPLASVAWVFGLTLPACRELLARNAKLFRLRKAGGATWVQAVGMADWDLPVRRHVYRHLQEFDEYLQEVAADEDTFAVASSVEQGGSDVIATAQFSRGSPPCARIKKHSRPATPARLRSPVGAGPNRRPRQGGDARADPIRGGSNQPLVKARAQHRGRPNGPEVRRDAGAALHRRGARPPQSARPGSGRSKMCSRRVRRPRYPVGRAVAQPKPPHAPAQRAGFAQPLMLRLREVAALGSRAVGWPSAGRGVASSSHQAPGVVSRCGARWCPCGA